MRASRSTPTIAVAAVALAGLLATATASCTQDQGSEKAFCKQVGKAPTVESVVAGFTNADPGELQARFGEATDAYAGLRDAAPSEIRDDMGTVADLVDAVVAAVKENRDDPEAVADQVRAAVKDHPGAIKATVTVAAYAAGHCNLQLNPSVDEGSSSTAVPTTPTTLGG